MLHFSITIWMGGMLYRRWVKVLCQVGINVNVLSSIDRGIDIETQKKTAHMINLYLAK